MKSIRPVSIEECVGRFRIITDAVAMGDALVKFADKDLESFQAAAQCCMALLDGSGDPEVARAAFIRALSDSGVFVKPD